MTVQVFAWLTIGWSVGIATEQIAGRDFRRIKRNLKWRYKRLKRKMF